MVSIEGEIGLPPTGDANDQNSSFSTFTFGIMANYAEIPEQIQAEELTNIDDELKEYMDEPIPPIDVDILLWWFERSTKYPNLSLLARFILAIPASSAAPERNFSTAGHIVSERRTRLSTSTVEEILICHSNCDLIDIPAQ